MGSLLKQVYAEFKDDRVLMLAAAVAFYSALSLAPLLLLALWVGSFLDESTRDSLTQELQTMLGGQSADLVEAVAEQTARRPNASNVAGVVGLIVLFVSASGVFAQLQTALNIVWDVRAKPSAGWVAFVRKRFLSLGMVVTIGFLLLASTIIGGVLQSLLGPAQEGGWLAYAVHFVISLAVTFGLFATVFHILPDVKTTWGQVTLGAAVTTVLFTIGRLAMSGYLAHKASDSVFGAAGSLLATLLWIYYSSVILFIGAEITQVWAQRQGARLEPNEFAVATT